MSSVVCDLTRSESRGKKRPTPKSFQHQAHKRERREDSTTSTTPSVGPSFPTLSHQDSDVVEIQRRPRDGLDCRRPAQTTGGSFFNPIDISESDEEAEITTDDSAPSAPRPRHAQIPPLPVQSHGRAPTRGPRFPAPIINVEDRGPDDGRSVQLARHQAAAGANATSHISLPPISELERQRSQSPPRNIPSWLQRSQQPANNLYQSMDDPDVFIIDDDEGGHIIGRHRRSSRPRELDSVETQMARNRATGRPLLTGINGGNPRTLTRAQSIMHRAQRQQQQQARAHAFAHGQVMAQHVPPPPRPAGYAAPVLNYFNAAWDYVSGGPRPEPVREPTPPMVPQYDPLPPCAQGFTRSPDEGEVLVCPRCQKELCVEDAGGVSAESSEAETRGKKKRTVTASEARQEVWVVKACGHVYCGTCAHSRSSKAPSKKSKGKQKESDTALPPFATCVAGSCTQKVTGKTSMIQLFL